MEKIILCPVGDQPEAIFPALREFKVSHVHMLTQKKYTRQAKKLKKELSKFGVPHSESKIEDNVWEETFARISEFAGNHPDKNKIVVHAGLGDRDTQCAAITAAFVSGLNAVNGDKHMVMGLPVLKFSYYTLLNDRKIGILKDLLDGQKSLNDISKDLKISLSLLSYHVHGNIKSEGLVDMGLVDLEERNNQTYISLTAMGKLLLRGYVPQCETC